MITDRTQADIDRAQSIRENFVKQFKSLTEEQITTLERGMLTVNTLNRIEGKQTELKDLLNAIGYWATDITNKTDWQIGDEVHDEDYKRIVSNENALRAAFLIHKTTPDTPNTFLHYGDTNSIEQILVDLQSMIDDVKDNWRECGNFECGEG